MLADQVQMPQVKYLVQVNNAGSFNDEFDWAELFHETYQYSL